MMVIRIRDLDNGVAWGAYMSNLGRNVRLAVFVIVTVVGAFGDGGKRLAGLDKIGNYCSMRPNATAARPLRITISGGCQIYLY